MTTYGAAAPVIQNLAGARASVLAAALDDCRDAGVPTHLRRRVPARAVETVS